MCVLLPEWQEEQQFRIASQQGGLGEYDSIVYCKALDIGTPPKNTTPLLIDMNSYDESEVHFEWGKIHLSNSKCT